MEFATTSVLPNSTELTLITSRLSEIKIDSRFQHVDQADDPAYFVNYLDRIARLPAIEQTRFAGQAFIGELNEGQIVEIGSGVGTMAARLATSLPKTVSVIGFDKSLTMVNEAKNRFCSIENLRFELGGFDSLSSNSIAAIWIERVLMHSHSPSHELAQSCEALRNGGKIVVVEPDWGTLVINEVDETLQSKWLSDACTFQLHGTVGRSLPVLLRDNGLHVERNDAVVVHFSSLTELNELLNVSRSTRLSAARGALTESEVSQLMDQMETADATHRLCGMVVIASAFGQRI